MEKELDANVNVSSKTARERRLAELEALLANPEEEYKRLEAEIAATHLAELKAEEEKRLKEQEAHERALEEARQEEIRKRDPNRAFGAATEDRSRVGAFSTAHSG